jgi:hypothetical protein
VEEFAEGLVKLGKQEVTNEYFRTVEDAYNESVSGAVLHCREWYASRTSHSEGDINAKCGFKCAVVGGERFL